MRPSKPTNLGRLLRRWRINEDMGIRELAKEIGLSASTMMRVEQGYGTDADTLLKILNWSMKRR